MYFRDDVPAVYPVAGLPEGFSAAVYMHERNSRLPWAFRLQPPQFLEPPRYADKHSALKGLQEWWRRNQPDEK